MKKKLLKAIYYVIIPFVSLTATAQRLPDVQEGGHHAPADIKIDGKNLEWKDVFLANNKRTHIFYTVSNDPKNLYLVIKAEDVKANSKILAGGITFSINLEGKKEEKESVTLSYPVKSNGGGSTVGITSINVNKSAEGVSNITITSGGTSTGASSSSEREIDSTRAVSQRKQLAKAKEIKISGFKTTADTLISIYNEHSIKAFASILLDNRFFYEVAIPLDALGLSAASVTDLAYNIKLNGLDMGFSGMTGVTIRSVNASGGSSGAIDFQDLMSPTDFWGKYTLVISN